MHVWQVRRFEALSYQEVLQLGIVAVLSGAPAVLALWRHVPCSKP